MRVREGEREKVSVREGERERESERERGRERERKGRDRKGSAHLPHVPSVRPTHTTQCIPTRKSILTIWKGLTAGSSGGTAGGGGSAKTLFSSGARAAAGPATGHPPKSAAGGLSGSPTAASAAAVAAVERSRYRTVTAVFLLASFATAVQVRPYLCLYSPYIAPI